MKKSITFEVRLGDTLKLANQCSPEIEKFATLSTRRSSIFSYRQEYSGFASASIPDIVDVDFVSIVERRRLVAVVDEQPAGAYVSDPLVP